MRARWIRRGLRAMLGIAALASGLATNAADAQAIAAGAPSDTTWRIELTDGSTLIGEVVARTPQGITVRTAGGVTVELRMAQIRSMSVARGRVRDGVLWPDDPNRTRLFFGPTGRMLAEGEGYVSVFELFLPFGAYAISNHLTIAGGTPIIPEAIGRVWYFAPKVGGSVAPRTSLSGGVIAFMEFGSNFDADFDSFGILYLVGTQGGEDHAATLGVGWGFSGVEVENRPVFMFGGETRLSPRIKLLSENYFVTYRDEPGRDTQVATLLSGGVRFFGERLSADAGLGVLQGSGDFFCCVPLVNFVYNFGGGR